ncbi:hypothetical protein RJ640_004482 [Escallonia rubra]|uniref:F-box domain-containing protein n=1 Tax=Escallonia rubra TaxID=112253 RepID=A0AA88S2I8_9ASTE|nr:hypothetical protein RJ640_004482 [Escallonia rubra]
MTLPSPKVVAKDEDRISNLPDEILHDILSCLPTKDAVGTCVLSKRWQFVWTHISGIDLEDDSNNNDPLQLERTMLFVDKLLSCRDVNINKVCLHFREGADLLGVYMWICSAIVRKVEELCINITVENVVLPRCIFTCESLTVLKLAMECIVKPPNAVFLPNLKILHLTSAKFSDDSSSQKLFCSFPVLEELSLTDCIWDNIRCISIVIPTLKTLMIDYYPFEFLNCEIKIRAERVVVFNCSGTLGINIIVSNLPLLEDATISLMPLYEEEEEEAARGINLLAGICYVRFLTMFEYTLTPVNNFVGFYNRLPVFENLTHLELKEMEFDDCTGKSLMIFLRHSPNLSSLVFAVRDVHYRGLGVGTSTSVLELTSKTVLYSLLWWEKNGDTVSRAFLATCGSIAKDGYPLFKVLEEAEGGHGSVTETPQKLSRLQNSVCSLPLAGLLLLRSWFLNFRGH